MDVSARSKDTFGGYHERIARSKTTHDHALRRGTYRSKRRSSGAFSGWRLALPSGLFALILATGALLLIGMILTFSIAARLATRRLERMTRA